MRNIKNFLQSPLRWFLLGFLLTPVFALGGMAGSTASVQNAFDKIESAFKSTSQVYAERIIAAGDHAQYRMEPVVLEEHSAEAVKLPGIKVAKRPNASEHAQRNFKIGQLQSQEITQQEFEDYIIADAAKVQRSVNRLPAFALIAQASYKLDPKVIAELKREEEKNLPVPIPVRKAKVFGWGERYYGKNLKFAERKKEIRCMAIGIYFEARSEPIRGQYAVAQVIMNRVKERFYPNSVCRVVYQGSHRKTGCQFSFTCDGISDNPRNRRLWRKSMRLAKRYLDGHVWLEDIGNASHYHATYVNPYWKKGMWYRKKIGLHIFYRGKFLHKKRYRKRRRAGVKYRRRQRGA